MRTSGNKLLGGLKTDGTGKIQFPAGVTRYKHPRWNWFFETVFLPIISVLLGLSIGAVLLVILIKAIIFLSPFL